MQDLQALHQLDKGYIMSDCLLPWRIYVPSSMAQCSTVHSVEAIRLCRHFILFCVIMYFSKDTASQPAWCTIHTTLAFSEYLLFPSEI